MHSNASGVSGTVIFQQSTIVVMIDIAIKIRTGCFITQRMSSHFCYRSQALTSKYGQLHEWLDRKGTKMTRKIAPGFVLCHQLVPY